MNDITSFQRVKMLSIVQVPQHSDAVLSTRSGQGTIGGNGDSVDVASVTVVVCSQLALGELPDLMISVRASYAHEECAHAFTTLSHPADTMTGFMALGLNLTQDTLTIL